MEEFFASGHAADLILGVLLIEAAWLRFSRGWTIAQLAGLLGAGGADRARPARCADGGGLVVDRATTRCLAAAPPDGPRRARPGLRACRPFPG
jgi:hypothetical protein